MNRPKPEPMWRRYLRFFGPNVAADVDDEVNDHMARLASELRERGTPEPEIEAAVRARFGDAEAIRARLKRSDDLRHRRRLRLEAFGSLGQDAAYALRRLRQRPGFTAAVVVVLALGVGATTAMFSAVDAAMLRPLPFPHADQLVLTNSIDVPADRSMMMGLPARTFRTPDIGDLAASTDVFSHVAACAAGGLNLADPVRPLRVQVGVVTSDFFATMGVEPVIGRAFSAAEGKPHGPAVTVLSDALWRTHFGGRPMLDSVVTLSGRQYTVVGIMPRGFNYPDESQLWIPYSNPMTFDTFAAFREYIPSVTIARLADHATSAAADARVLDLWKQAESSVSPGDTAVRSNFDRIIRDGIQNGFAVPFRRYLVSDARRALLVLLGATALLLLIACANVTNLLLSQAAMRRREIAVRAVLGATRSRVMRQMLTESVLLAVAGTALGIVAARPLLGAVNAVMPKAMVGIAPPGVDWRVLAFAAGLALATGIGFGMWPAVGAARADLSEAIKGASGRGATSGGAGRGRRLVVGAELALAVMLLVGTGLMLRSLRHLVTLNTGLEPEHTATLEMSFGADVRSQARRMAEIDAIVARLEAAPGIQAAGVVNRIPLAHEGGIGLWIGREGLPPQEGKPAVVAGIHQASGGYFRAMGIPLLEGRTFSAADDSGAPRVAIVDRALADTTWPGEDPVGRKFVFGAGGADPITVIGVVAQVRGSLTDDPGYQVYQPVHQMVPGTFIVVARGTLPPRAMLARLRDAVHAVDGTQAVYRVRMMTDVVTTSIAPQRTNALLISLFGALALVLTALGVYAVVAYSVAMRRRELGIRAALGAGAGDLVRLVSREMVWITLGGLAVGLGVAWAASRVMASLLYGVTTHDPMTFLLAPLALVVPAVLATLIPARRAARTNPVDVMREE
jgi:putative ABC transport system permease protein